MGWCPGEGEGGAVGCSHTEIAYGGWSWTHRLQASTSDSLFISHSKTLHKGAAVTHVSAPEP